MPRGSLKEAAVPVPLANARNPLPASVLTTPPGVIFLMRELNVSATYTKPHASVAIP
jgi:hypothetical protein